MNLLINNKLYKVLAVSKLLNSLGAYLYNVVFVLYAATHYESGAAVAIANCVMVLPTLFTFFLGIQADRTKNKASKLIVTSLVQALLFVVMSVILQNHTIGVFACICLMNLFSDMLSDYAAGLQLPIMQKNVKEEQLMEAYSFFQLIVCVSGLGGQALGVWLLSVTGNHFGLLALLNAVLFIASGLFLYFHRKLLTHEPVKETAGKPLKEQMENVLVSIQAVFELKNARYFVWILVAVLLTNLLGGSVSALYIIQLLTVEIGGLSYAQGLLLLNVVMVISMILGNLTPHDRIAQLSLPHMLVLNAAVLVALGLVNVLSLPSFLGIGLLAVASYIGGKVTPKIDALILTHTPSELLASTNHLLTTFFTLSLPLGTIFFSFLAGFHLNLAWGFFSGLAGLVFALSFGLFFQKQVTEVSSESLA